MEGQVCVGPRPLLCRGRVAGVRGAWPPPGRCGRNSLGHYSCSTSWAAKASHIRWVSVARTRQVDAFLAGVPDRQAFVECVAWSRVVGLCEGVLLGQLGSPGVVAVDGWFCSCWFDASRRVLWREEVIQGPPYRLLTCGRPVCDTRHVCAAVCRRCTASDRLR